MPGSTYTAMSSVWPFSLKFLPDTSPSATDNFCGVPARRPSPGSMCQWPVTESTQLGQWFCALALAPKPSPATKPSNQVRLIGEPLRSVDSWGFSISHAAGWWDSELVNRGIGGLGGWWIGGVVVWVGGGLG